MNLKETIVKEQRMEVGFTDAEIRKFLIERAIRESGFSFDCKGEICLTTKENSAGFEFVAKITLVKDLN